MMVLFGMAVFLQRDWLPEADGLTLPDFSGDAVTQKQQWAALMPGNGSLLASGQQGQSRMYFLRAL
jgi:hypothetical protein